MPACVISTGNIPNSTSLVKLGEAKRALADQFLIFFDKLRSFESDLP